MILRREIKSYLVVAFAIAVSLSSVSTSWAGVRDQITTRRVLGVAFLGGSAFLTVQGFDFKDEADEFYDRYQQAIDPTEIDRLYQRTTNRDVKSQVSWALATAFAISGVRLLLSGDYGERRLERAASLRPVSRGQSASMNLHIQPQLGANRVGIELRKPLF